MFSDQVALLIILSILLWGVGAFFHHYLFPEIKREKLKDVVEFIAACWDINFDPRNTLPSLSFYGRDDLIELIPMEDRWELIANSGTRVMGLYFREWNRIVFARESREDWLAHEAAHYVCRTYGAGTIESPEKEEEAVWKATRFFLLVRYPMRYMVIMVLYGFFGVWGYDCLRHSLVDGPA